MNCINLSKEVSYVLRHNPNKYNLLVDEKGYVEIEDLFKVLNSNSKLMKKLQKQH